MGKTNTQGAISPKRYLKERVRSLEIGKCYINTHWKEEGLASIVVTRKHKQGTYTVGMYMVDTFCLGVKDTLYKFCISESEYEYLTQGGMFDTEEISYNEAHNIIFAAIEFAEEGGIQPHKDWALTRYILEEDDDNVPLIDYEMGRNGKHFLVVHNQQELNKYMPTLKKNLGEEVDFLFQDDD